MKKLRHIRQSDSARNCTAACLAMLYNKYLGKGKLKEITNRVSTFINGSPSCRNSLAVLDAVNHGFVCCGVSARDIKTLVKICSANKIELLLMHRPDPNSNEGHCVLAVSHDDRNVYVYDPLIDPPKGVNKPMSFDFLESSMKASGTSHEINMNNTFLLLAFRNAAPKTTLILGPYGEIECFECVEDEIEAILDPNKDRWLFRNQSTDPAPPTLVTP